MTMNTPHKQHAVRQQTSNSETTRRISRKISTEHIGRCMELEGRDAADVASDITHQRITKDFSWVQDAVLRKIRWLTARSRDRLESLFMPSQTRKRRQRPAAFDQEVMGDGRIEC